MHGFLSMIEPRLRTIDTLKPLSQEDLFNWFMYYFTRGTVSVVADPERKYVKGVCVLKFFRSLYQMDTDYCHEPDGLFCQVEAFAADGPETMLTIWRDLESRWGQPPIVLWSRGPKRAHTKPHMYNWGQFERLARKYCYECTENA